MPTNFTRLGVGRGRLVETLRTLETTLESTLHKVREPFSFQFVSIPSSVGWLQPQTAGSIRRR